MPGGRVLACGLSICAWRVGGTPLGRFASREGVPPYLYEGVIGKRAAGTGLYVPRDCISRFILKLRHVKPRVPAAHAVCVHAAAKGVYEVPFPWVRSTTTMHHPQAEGLGLLLEPLAGELFEAGDAHAWRDLCTHLVERVAQGHGQVHPLNVAAVTSIYIVYLSRF